MTGKRALVTGAGARLGQAMAIHLGSRGYDVAVHYAASAQGADATAAAISAVGGRAVTLHADLLSEEATATMVSRAAEALGGPLTVLVNNASIFEYDNIRTATRESWDRHMGSNLRAPFVLTQAFAAQCPDPLTDEAGEPVAQGLIVNMVDQRVNRLTPEFMTYTLAKTALWTLTRTAAQALGPRVRVNAIGPGPTLKGAKETDDHFETSRRATILGRGANPADVVAALGFFLDSPAVTGQLIAVDGGQHLAWKAPGIGG